MFQYFSSDLSDGLAAANAQKAQRKTRRRLVADGREYPLSRLWDDGLAVDAALTTHLRGLVDVYDGANHIQQCLIIASEVQAGQLICSFKRSTTISDRPALDYERDENAPVAYLPRY